MARLSKISTLVFLLSLFICQIQASHHIYRELQSSSTQPKENDPYRTGYHFQPPKNWINDPNGPMLYKGIYHLFYQYNPKGVAWGNIVWAHSTSTDLVNWTPQPVAIKPSIESDINGTWSGSATFLPDGKPAILYTGINPQNDQVQNLALPKDPSDPYLKEWIKVPQNPLMYPTPENNINASSFRDPTTAWKLPDGRWRVIIGNKIDTTGRVILYRSRDFIKWTEAKHPLHSGKGSGMWECPDFFPVYKNTTSDGAEWSVIGDGVKHILKVSLDNTRHDVYTVGRYDTKKDKYVPDNDIQISDTGLRYDYGKFYASKTFFDDSTQRRILWGWINESSTAADDLKKGWSGIQAVPRHIWLDESQNQLVQWPIMEIEKLRMKPVYLHGKELIKSGSKIKVSGVTASQADVEISFKISDLSKADKFDPKWTNPALLCGSKNATVKGGLGPFGLLTLASKGLEEYTAVFFRIFKSYETNKFVVLMCSDQSKSTLNPTTDKAPYGSFVVVDPINEDLSLRTLIDHSIVESFGAKGKNCITPRVYPTIAIGDDAHLFVFNYGNTDMKITNFIAWSMKTAKIN